MPGAVAAIRQSATMEADAATDRIVMGFSTG
jgi:hypothetical protein